MNKEERKMLELLSTVATATYTQVLPESLMVGTLEDAEPEINAAVRFGYLKMRREGSQLLELTGAGLTVVLKYLDNNTMQNVVQRTKMDKQIEDFVSEL